MDLATCLKKMELVGVLAFATVDSEGAPQIRNISAIHYEPDALYFFTARGKNFCKELMEDGSTTCSIQYLQELRGSASKCHKLRCERSPEYISRPQHRQQDPDGREPGGM